jgi:hypothetical protein
MPRRPLPGPRGGERLFAAGVTCAFLLAGALVVTHHEPWRDEMQAWLLARDSGSVRELFSHLRYEGHPGLWHLLLFAAQRAIGGGPGVMQGLHLAIAAATVALVSLRAPFSRAQRGLFAFGYFPFYEYGIISRNYALGLLLLVAACALVPSRRTRLPLLGLVTALMAHSSAIALIVAVALAATLGWEWLDERRRPAPLRLGGFAPSAPVGFALMLAGIGTAAYQLLPPADSGFNVAWHWSLEPSRLWRVLLLLPEALLPIPLPRLNYWNSVTFAGTAWLRVAAVIAALGIAIWAYRRLRARPLARRFFVTAELLLLGFFYAKYIGNFNHHGFLFATLIAALWIGGVTGEDDQAAADREPAPGAPPTGPGVVLTALLGAQLVAGVMAAALDWAYPFSRGPEGARILTEHHLERALLVADPDFTAASFLAYLPGTPAYYPRGDRFGTFTVWDRQRLRPTFDRDVVDRALRARSMRGTDVVIVLNHPLDRAAAEGAGAQSVAALQGSVVGDEDFYAYLLPKGAEGRP